MARLSFGLVALFVMAMPAMTSFLGVVEAECVEQINGYPEEGGGGASLWPCGFRDDFIQDHEQDGLPGVRADARGQPASIRDYLNSLVETSAAARNQLSNIAFVKTHKTGSTSMAAILYRYALRHGQKIKKNKYERVDIMHYHISPRGQFNGKWSEAHEHYRGIMRDPDSVNFITVMREPRSHFLSVYYYYLQPINKLSLEEFLSKQPRNPGQFNLLRNPLSAEFGAKTLTQVEHLIAHALPSFKLIFLTDRFDEGLMILRRILGWSMIDMTYITLNETKAGSRRWDGKPFVDTPSFDDLPEKVQNKIDALTTLDQRLYTAAKEEYAKRLQSMSGVIQADLEEFDELQDLVSGYLHANDSSMANAMYRTMNVYNRAPPLTPF
eukprot:jgi/Undpi1/8344/HiC_scaffold_25.g10812.m2